MKKAKVGMKVVDRWFSFRGCEPFGFGIIKKLTSRSAYIKFTNLEQVKRYDKEHLESFIAVFNKQNMTHIDFVKENKYYSLFLNKRK